MIPDCSSDESNLLPAAIGFLFLIGAWVALKRARHWEDVRRLIVGLSLLLVVALTGGAYTMYKRLEQLEHGNIVEGKVAAVCKRTARRGHTYAIEYTFPVGGEDDGNGEARISYDQTKEFRAGDTIEVAYDPDDPTLNMALLAKEAASESLWVAVACIGVALLPVVLLRPQSYEDRLRDEDEDEDEDAAAGDNHSAA